MKTTKNLLKTVVLLVITFMASCSKDAGITQPMGSANSKTNFYMTDAPTDNANVKGVFVTVADVKIDGVSIQNFSKTTINLMDYQKGLTKLMGNLDLQQNTQSNISLVLDYSKDAQGNAPGCYVLMADGSAKAIQSTSNTININHSFEVLANSTNDIVLDFDVRKSVVANGASDFKFVTMAELSNSIRVVNKAKAGTITGTANDTQNTSDKIVVYAYKKGTYDANTETQPQGQSGVMFANAVSSSVVSKSDATYKLSFLENGDYELHFASYNQDSTNPDSFQFKGMLKAQSVTGLDLNNISVGSSLKLNVAVTFNGML